MRAIVERMEALLDRAHGPGLLFAQQYGMTGTPYSRHTAITCMKGLPTSSTTARPMRSTRTAPAASASPTWRDG